MTPVSPRRAGARCSDTTIIRIDTMLRIRRHVIGLALAAAVLAAAPGDALGQKKNRPERSGTPDLVTFSIDMTAHIRDFYGARPTEGALALPPGIRKRLERGKPLPPGIAKKVAPAGLRSQLGVPRGFEVMEVGLDVLLVEVATGVIHDVLMDVVR